MSEQEGSENKGISETNTIKVHWNKETNQYMMFNPLTWVWTGWIWTLTAVSCRGAALLWLSMGGCPFWASACWLTVVEWKMVACWQVTGTFGSKGIGHCWGWAGRAGCMATACNVWGWMVAASKSWAWPLCSIWGCCCITNWCLCCWSSWWVWIWVYAGTDITKDNFI